MTVAVNGVDLSVGARQVVAVIGESGSGKSTLAQVIAGLHLPERGEIRLAGKVLAPAVARRSLEERRRVQVNRRCPRVGFVAGETGQPE